MGRTSAITTGWHYINGSPEIQNSIVRLFVGAGPARRLRNLLVPAGADSYTYSLRNVGSGCMLVGPVFTREAVTAPRRTKFYVSRSAYVGGLWLLMCTAWLLAAGTQLVRNVGDFARFGGTLFQLLALLQLALAVFFSALSSASAVAQEKDRKTLVLLLLTKLNNSELVLGKLLASMLNVLVLLAAGIPLFMLVILLGGVSLSQIVRVTAVTLASALAAGSLGSTLALWREKTFQTLALAVLAIVFWLAGWEAVHAGILGPGWLGLNCQTWAIAFSPWQAIQEATRPYAVADPALGWLGSPVNLFLATSLAAAAALNLAAIVMVRVWNPSREFGRVQEEPARASIWGAEFDVEQEEAARASQTVSAAAETSALPTVAPGKTVAELASAAIRRRELARARSREGTAPAPRLTTREVWDNPILWREIRTWAYGRRMLLIRLAYLALFGLAAAATAWLVQETGTLSGFAMLLVPLIFVVSLTLVNAQAVTALTNERDAKALDLLLVTDLTPKEFIFGKMAGVLYNTKEMVVLPILLCGYLWYAGMIRLEELVFLTVGAAVMNAFVSMVGIHVGMAYANSRQAVAVSLGTVFFLFVGVAVCMRMMVAFSGSFQMQIQPFLALVLGGGLGLYLALGARNPSSAILMASVVCPFATFYSITSFILDMPMAVFLVTSLTYAFTTAALLVPALYEFDVATGRTTGGEE